MDIFPSIRDRQGEGVLTFYLPLLALCCLDRCWI
jgi:hypothetical protein